MKNILIIGATSAIAESTSRIYASEGDRFYLLARNTDRLNTIAADLKIRGAAYVETGFLDVNDTESHQRSLDVAIEKLGSIDIALIAHGTLGDQKACEHDPALAIKELHTNAISTIFLLTILANMMELQGKGTIAVISSVAGDRGRPSNYVYGTAKAAVSAFCEGMRARLYKHGVLLLTIKPGMVATPMTRNIDAPELLISTPDFIAKDIVDSVAKKKEVIYTPKYWRYIMAVISSIPDVYYKKLRL
jgi:hypothetical protein